MVRYSLLAAVVICITTAALASPVGSTSGNREAIVINSNIPPERVPCGDGNLCSLKPKNLSGPRDKRGPPAALQNHNKDRYKNEKENKNKPLESHIANANGENDSRRTEPKPPFSPMSDGTYSEKETNADTTYYDSGSGYGNGYEYGYTNKGAKGKHNGAYWGNSDDSVQKEFNCPGCHKDFDEVSSHIKEGKQTDCPICAGMDNEVSSSESIVDSPSETRNILQRAEIPRNTAALNNGPRFAAVCVVTQLSQMCIAAGNAVCSPKGDLDTKDLRCTRACNCVRV